MLGIMRSRTPSAQALNQAPLPPRGLSRASGRDSELYVRPYTPTIDYSASIDGDDGRSRDLGSISQFSVSAFNAKAADANSVVSQATLKGAGEAGGGCSDSGVESASQDSPSQAASELRYLRKGELGAQADGLCRELRTVASLSEDFVEDVETEAEAAAALVAELDSKIRPFLITLDEEMSSLEASLRGNLDACRIAEPRVSWLLVYNRFLLTFRAALDELAREIFDPLERLLRLRERGCDGLVVPPLIPKRLRDMAQRLAKADAEIARERALPEDAYA